MKVKIQQIVWHNKEPVFAADFHPSGVLATAGADSEIKVSTIHCTTYNACRPELARRHVARMRN